MAKKLIPLIINLIILILVTTAFAGKVAFERDMTQCRDYLGKEFKIYKQFIESLTPEDKYILSYGLQKTFSPKVQILKNELSGYGDSCFRHRFYPQTNMPALTFNPNFGSTTWYYKFEDVREKIKRDYQLFEKSDEIQAIKAYCAYWLDFLDKFQTLIELWKGKNIKDWNNMYNTPIFVFDDDVPEYELELQGRGAIRSITYGLIGAAHSDPLLYEIGEFLTCEKAWIEFALNTKSTITPENPLAHLEKNFADELEYIAKVESTLAKKELLNPLLDKSSVKKEADSIPINLTDPLDKKDQEKKNFRLELPLPH